MTDGEQPVKDGQATYRRHVLTLQFAQAAFLGMLALIALGVRPTGVLRGPALVTTYAATALAAFGMIYVHVRGVSNV